MRVQRRREAVVQVLGGRAVAAAEVERLGHAARGQDADELVEVGVVRPRRRVQRLCQRLQGSRSGAQRRPKP